MQCFVLMDLFTRRGKIGSPDAFPFQRPSIEYMEACVNCMRLDVLMTSVELTLPTRLKHLRMLPWIATTFQPVVNVEGMLMELRLSTSKRG